MIPAISLQGAQLFWDAALVRLMRTGESEEFPRSGSLAFGRVCSAGTL